MVGGIDGYCAVQHGGNGTADGKPKSNALLEVVDFVESVENGIGFVGRYSHASVGDGKCDALPTFGIIIVNMAIKRDAAMLGILNGISEQICQDFIQAAAVGDDAEIVGDCGLKFQTYTTVYGVGDLVYCIVAHFIDRCG